MTWWVASLAEKLNAFAVATWLNFNLKNAKKVRVSLRALSKSQNWPAGPWPHQSFCDRSRAFILGFVYFTRVAFFRFKMDLGYNTIYIFFSEQSKKGCQVANGKPLCGASPGED